jgi:hypothetical protein
MNFDSEEFVSYFLVQFQNGIFILESKTEGKR